MVWGKQDITYEQIKNESNVIKFEAFKESGKTVNEFFGNFIDYDKLNEIAKSVLDKKIYGSLVENRFKEVGLPEPFLNALLIKQAGLDQNQISQFSLKEKEDLLEKLTRVDEKHLTTMVNKEWDW